MLLSWNMFFAKSAKDVEYLRGNFYSAYEEFDDKVLWRVNMFHLTIET